MANNNELDLGPEFDDDECIRYILNLIPEEDKKGMTEDDVQYVLDVIFDFYDSIGLIQDDQVSDASIDETEELDFVRKAAQKDHINLTDEQIQLILDGEYAYGLEKGIYEEEDD